MILLLLVCSLQYTFVTLCSLPDTYTDFRKNVETRSKVRIEKPMPDKLRQMPDGAVQLSAELPSLNDLGLTGTYNEMLNVLV